MNVRFESLKISSRQVPEASWAKLWTAFMLLTLVVFSRPPSTNFIFDEQEALLANPYLTGELPLAHLLEVDFWGRSPERTIGSYRPVPNLLWRSLSFTLKWHSPWALTLFNLVLHALNATLLSRCALKLLPSKPQVAWGTGGLFLVLAINTEAVCGVVGLADVLVAFFTLVASYALLVEARSPRLFLVVFLALFLGCLSKETQLTLLPGVLLVPFLAEPDSSLSRAWRQTLAQRLSIALLGGLLAQWAAVLLRKAYFPIEVTPILEPLDADIVAQFRSWLVHYWQLPPWPHDVFNNPLLAATRAERWSTASSIYLDQLRQLILPWDLTGDYSMPRQAVHAWDATALAGASLFLISSLAAFFLLWRSWRDKHVSSLTFAAVGTLWLNASFFPISGALFALPTIRGERLFYPASIGAVVLMGAVLVSCWGRIPFRVWLTTLLAFFVLQTTWARLHALDFSDDLAFWRGAANSEQASAKSLLNLGVMLGARGDLDARLRYTKRAASLLPAWPMGQIYLADTYCRRGEMREARPHYERGLALAANSKAMTALSLQCIWEKGSFVQWRSSLNRLAQENTGSWLDYFVYELVERGEENDGIPVKYRPRYYNRRRGGE